MQISREFIHGKRFDEQWKALGLNDEHLEYCDEIEPPNPMQGASRSDGGSHLFL